MTDTENQERVAQVRARLQAISPLPWEVASHCDAESIRMGGVERNGSASSLEVQRLWTCEHELPEDDDNAEAIRQRSEATATAQFIASAPTDLAFLLSRVDSLESALREATQDVQKQFADEGWEIASVKDAAAEMDRLSSTVRIEAAQRIAAERLHAKHCGLECCEVRDEYEAKTRQQPIGADTGGSNAG